MTHRSAVAAFSLLSLLGCGKEAGRVPFSGTGTNSAAFPLSSGKVTFWSDLDIEYVGPARLEYRIDLIQAGHNVVTTVCNPLGPMSVKLVWVEIQRGAYRSRSGSGRMDCSVSLATGGPTTIEATLAFGTKPATLTLKKADLVIKQ